jgi:hypothetical protein
MGVADLPAALRYLRRRRVERVAQERFLAVDSGDARQLAHEHEHLVRERM